MIFLIHTLLLLLLFYYHDVHFLEIICVCNVFIKKKLNKKEFPFGDNKMLLYYKHIDDLNEYVMRLIAFCEY